MACECFTEHFEPTVEQQGLTGVQAEPRVSTVDTREDRMDCRGMLGRGHAQKAVPTLPKAGQDKVKVE